MNEQLLSASVGAFATLGAATLAGFFTFLASVLAKEQKTSEFRQAWIDALSNDLANLAAHAGTITILNLQDYSNEELKVHRKEALFNLNLSTSRLRLRLNPSEDISQEIFGYIGTLAGKIGDGDPEKSGFNHALDQFTGCGQRLLKTEWKRVKKGELTFRLVKWSSLSIFIVGVLTPVAICLS